MGGTIGDNGTGGTTLAKNDSGTWVLTGNNSFTGNTVINDGNLMIGNGGTTGNAGAGNVIVDSPTSTLSLNRSDTFTFSGTLSGPGTLAQIGTGTSVLTSAHQQYRRHHDQRRVRCRSVTGRRCADDADARP